MAEKVDRGGSKNTKYVANKNEVGQIFTRSTMQESRGKERDNGE